MQDPKKTYHLKRIFGDFLAESGVHLFFGIGIYFTVMSEGRLFLGLGLLFLILPYLAIIYYWKIKKK